jgi:hypothetical protein
MNRAERLGALRAELARMGVQGFLIPRADEHSEGGGLKSWLRSLFGG